MTLAVGTNCGFVTEAPTGDPEETEVTVDTEAHAMKVTSPAGANRITEIGWYCQNATEEANFEVAVYDHNSGDNNPEAVVGIEQTNAKGTSAGWKKATGLNIPISAETVYWLAVQVDNTATSTKIDWKSSGGGKVDRKTSQTTLTDPWGVTGSTYGDLLAIYAVYESASENINSKCGGIGIEGLAAGESPGIYK